METDEKQRFSGTWQAILSQIGPQYALTGPFTLLSQRCSLLEVQSRLRFNSLHGVDNWEGSFEFRDGKARTIMCEAEWYQWHTDQTIELIETKLTIQEGN